MFRVLLCRLAIADKNSIKSITNIFLRMVLGDS